MQSLITVTFVRRSVAPLLFHASFPHFLVLNSGSSESTGFEKFRPAQVAVYKSRIRFKDMIVGFRTGQVNQINKSIWCGLIHSGLLEFYQSFTNNSTYNGYKSALLSKLLPFSPYLITSGSFLYSIFSLLSLPCCFCKYYTYSVSCALEKI